MSDVTYKPEGMLITTSENSEYVSSISGLERARISGKILEARTLLCDRGHNLIVELPGVKGIIPREETVIGISEGLVRDVAILTRVNKPVCFKVSSLLKQPDGSTVALLSRKQAQMECMENYVKMLEYGQIVDARVTHLEPFGCFADIGCGIIALLSIDNISVSRISHPCDRFFSGENIKAVIKSRDEDTNRINLSHKELLGTWEENSARFAAGQTVAGIIRSVEDYGIFVELTPNLAGLAEFRPGSKVGQYTSVFIKSITPERMKIKLIIVDSFDAAYDLIPMDYFLTEGKLDKWIYSPERCTRVIETIF